MISDTTRRHKTWFQEIDFLKNLKILTKSWRILYISGRIQNMGRIQLESTSKIITIGIENSSFGYDLLTSHEKTRNPTKINRNPKSWKWTRTRMDTSWGIKSHQEWYLTPRDFIKRDFNKSIFSRFPSCCQNCGCGEAHVLWFRTWGGHN